MTPRVWNKRSPHVPPDAVYVGRPTKWGNPFKLFGERGTPIASREQVIARYRHRLVSTPQLLADARRELVGKDLVCWCAPLPCHADVLLELANAPESES